MKYLQPTLFKATMVSLALSGLFVGQTISADDTPIQGMDKNKIEVISTRINYSITEPSAIQVKNYKLGNPYDSEGNLSDILYDNLNSGFDYY